MNERADAERVRRATPNTPTMEDEQRWSEEGPFTRREWQRLVFLRWLYSQGLLTEWPEHPGGSPPRGVDRDHAQATAADAPGASAWSLGGGADRAHG